MTKAKQEQAARQRSQRVWVIAALTVVVFVFVCLCGIVMALLPSSSSVTETPAAEQDARDATLTLAYTPDKAALMRILVDRFNAQDLRTADRQSMQVQLVELTPDVMIEEALAEHYDLAAVVWEERGPVEVWRLR